MLLEKWIQFYQKLILELEKSDCSTWDEINHYLDENDSYDGNDRTWSRYLDNSRETIPSEHERKISEFSELLKETYLECLKDKKQAEQFAYHFPMLQNGVEFILSNY